MEGLNLTISIVLYPVQVEVIRQFSISQAISLGLADFLSHHVGNVSVKWPNDIYVDDRKIAGILIETAISGGKFSRAIVGIGLNINQEKFVSDAPNPVSLKNLTGKDYDLDEILDDLCNKLDKRYQSLISGDYVMLKNDYEKLLYRRGIMADYRAEDGDFEGMLSGVGEDGRLLIKARSGEVRSFMFKEVAFI
jgi:BirA family biotin operon repressor/biotin-[acetyl-CoA-carboxylase] ligase